MKYYPYHTLYAATLMTVYTRMCLCLYKGNDQSHYPHIVTLAFHESPVIKSRCLTCVPGHQSSGCMARKPTEVGHVI